MHALPTDIPDVVVFEPTLYPDKRGFFFESYNQKKFEEAIGQTVNFVQDNHSKSAKDVLRGLHYQLLPKTQGKLIRVIQGEVYDVAVDIRRDSQTFGEWVGLTLSAENRKQLWIPAGFAHGFLTLTESAELLYKITDYYEPGLERCIKWDDSEIGIDWPIDREPIMSEKDRDGSLLRLAVIL